MDAIKLQYNIHHIKESFHPSFNQGLHKLLVQRRRGGGGSIPFLQLYQLQVFYHLQHLSLNP